MNQKRKGEKLTIISHTMIYRQYNIKMKLGIPRWPWQAMISCLFMKQEILCKKSVHLPLSFLPFFFFREWGNKCISHCFSIVFFRESGPISTGKLCNSQSYSSSPKAGSVLLRVEKNIYPFHFSFPLPTVLI